MLARPAPARIVPAPSYDGRSPGRRLLLWPERSTARARCVDGVGFGGFRSAVRTPGGAWLAAVALRSGYRHITCVVLPGSGATRAGCLFAAPAWSGLYAH